jgi:DNA polymerase III alpha subunit
VLTTLFENYADEVKIDNKILAEEELLGTLVTVDPLGPYATLIAAEETFPGEHQMLTGEVCRLGGVITKVTQLITKKGKNPGAEMAQVWIEIPSTEISIEEGDDDEEEITKRDESIQVVIFPSTYEKIRSKLDRGAPVLMDVEKLQNGGLSVRRMFRLDEMK